MRRAPCQWPVLWSGDHPAVGWSGGGDRVEHPRLTHLTAVVDGVLEEIAFDGGGDDRSVPFEEGGDGESGGLAGSGRSDDRDRMLGLGGDQPSPDGAEGEPARLGAVDE